MIVYHHMKQSAPPNFLSGARDLCACPALRGGCFFGIGPHYLCGFDEASHGVDLGDGWKAMVVGAVDPFALRRELVGQPVVGLLDMHGRIWQAPVILREDGTRAFPVKYGKDWKPVLSKEQTALVEHAREARALLPRIINGSNAEREELMPVVCNIAAAALAYANHVSVPVIAALDLLDTALAVGTATALCSYIEDSPEPNA